MKPARQLLLFIFILCIFTASEDVDAQIIEPALGNKIVLELPYLPKRIKPGDKPITLNEEILRKLFPELSNPRLLSLQDLGDSNEQKGFLEGGYSIVLRGDFNKDGFADISFVGKYDNPKKSDENCFVAIVSIRGNKVIREYWSKLETTKAYLIRVIEYKPKLDAIGIIFNLYSDKCGYLYWDKNQYIIAKCQSSF